MLHQPVFVSASEGRQPLTSEHARGDAAVIIVNKITRIHMSFCVCTIALLNTSVVAFSLDFSSYCISLIKAL